MMNTINVEFEHILSVLFSIISNVVVMFFFYRIIFSIIRRISKSYNDMQESAMENDGDFGKHYDEQYFDEEYDIAEDEIILNGKKIN